MSDKGTDTKEDDNIELENLPMHALRTKVKDMGLTAKSNAKKKDLIKMIVTGEEIKEKKKEPKKLDNSPKQPKQVALMPKSVKELCEKHNIRYEIDEDTCSVTFFGAIPVSCTLDQSEKNIHQALMQTRVIARPIETSSTRNSFI